MLSERIIPEKSGYKQLADQAGELLTGVWFTDLANISALLFETLPDVNWVGFYLMHQGRLQLGPFQGRVACTHIPRGRGVCGEAAAFGSHHLRQSLSFGNRDPADFQRCPTRSSRCRLSVACEIHPRRRLRASRAGRDPYESLR
jgi:hypothetical protein